MDDCPLLYLPDEWRRLQELRRRIIWHRDQYPPGHPDYNARSSDIDALDRGIYLLRPTDALILQIVTRARGCGVDLNFSPPEKETE